MADENQIDNMSWVFFDDVMMELGHRLNYEAIVNYAGNAFCEKSWDMIENAHPLRISANRGSAKNSFASFLAGSKITVLQKDDGGYANGKEDPDSGGG